MTDSSDNLDTNSEVMPDDDAVTPSGKQKYEAYIESLQQEKARAEAEKKALVEEFTKSIPDEWSPDDLKAKIKDLLGDAYARLSKTINDDDNKVLAFNAAKYVFQIGIGAVKVTDDNDPNKELKDLLSALTDPEAKHNPVPKTDPS